MRANNSLEFGLKNKQTSMRDTVVWGHLATGALVKSHSDPLSLCVEICSDATSTPWGECRILLVIVPTLV
jgi:hypothetical protein